MCSEGAYAISCELLLKRVQKYNKNRRMSDSLSEILKNHANLLIISSRFCKIVPCVAGKQCQFINIHEAFPVNRLVMFLLPFHLIFDPLGKVDRRPTMPDALFVPSADKDIDVPDKDLGMRDSA